jgi:hypothetical protein
MLAFVFPFSRYANSYIEHIFVILMLFSARAALWVVRGCPQRRCLRSSRRSPAWLPPARLRSTRLRSFARKYRSIIFSKQIMPSSMRFSFLRVYFPCLRSFFRLSQFRSVPPRACQSARRQQAARFSLIIASAYFKVVALSFPHTFFICFY